MGEGFPPPHLNKEAIMATTNTETKRKMVKIKIPRTRADEEDVFVSVNMETFLIKRGVEVEVPDYVAEVLQHQEEMLEKIMLFNDAKASK
jgi:hypothetical protein